MPTIEGLRAMAREVVAKSQHRGHMDNGQSPHYARQSPPLRGTQRSGNREKDVGVHGTGLLGTAGNDEDGGA